MTAGREQDQQSELRERIESFLAAHHVMTLATHGTRGLWAAAVFYASDGTDFYFLSSPKSRHAENLQERAAVAATVQPDYDDWPGIRGVQLEGEVLRLEGAAAERARALYARKFPLVSGLGPAPASLLAALTRVKWYRLRPARLFFVDNTRGFGNREELRCRED